MEKLNGQRKMHLSNQPDLTPERELIQIQKWVTDDIQKMQSTLWMILQNQDILEAIAKVFQEKMNKEKPVNQIVKALSEQIDQPKAE